MTLGYELLVKKESHHDQDVTFDNKKRAYLAGVDYKLRPTPTPTAPRDRHATMRAPLPPLLLLPATAFAATPHVSGYVRHDAAGDGRLPADRADGGGDGIVDAIAQLRPCDDGDDDAVLAGTATGWPPAADGAAVDRRSPGHSPVYPGGGYYRLDLADVSSRRAPGGGAAAGGGGDRRKQAGGDVGGGRRAVP